VLVRNPVRAEIYGLTTVLLIAAVTVVVHAAGWLPMIQSMQEISQ